MLSAATDWTTFLAPALIVIAVNGAFACFRRRCPLKEKDVNLATEPISDAWTAISGVAILSCGTAVAFGAVGITQWANRHLADPNGKALFVLTPSVAWWYLYAGFLGLTSAYMLAKPILRLWMGTVRFDAWTAQGNRKVGFNSGRALNILGVVIMVPYTLLFLPSLVCHTRFTPSYVEVQKYAELHGAKYLYSDVQRIAVVSGYRDRSGALQHDPRLVIDFADGRRWSSRDSFRDPETINQRLVAFLSEKTKLSVEVADTADKLPQSRGRTQP